MVIEDLPGCRRLQKIELGIEFQGAVQIVAGPACIAPSTSYHSGVVKDPRIPGAEPQSIPDGALRLVELARLKSSPCQGVRAIYVLAGLVLVSRVLVRLFRLQVVIGVKQRKLSVIEHAIYLGQVAYPVDQL